MLIEFDSVKRALTLQNRGLDFTRAVEVFAGKHLSKIDSRTDYAEPRTITAGWLDGRIIVMVWTPRGAARRIISMRKANEREINAIGDALDES